MSLEYHVNVTGFFFPVNLSRLLVSLKVPSGAPTLAGQWSKGGNLGVLYDHHRHAVELHPALFALTTSKKKKPKKNTPLLFRYVDGEGRERYRPAYQLEDASRERDGRKWKKEREREREKTHTSQKVGSLPDQTVPMYINAHKRKTWSRPVSLYSVHLVMGVVLNARAGVKIVGRMNARSNPSFDPPPPITKLPLVA